MKETQLTHREKTQLEAKKQQEKKTEIKHTATIYPHNNHKLWEVNTETLEVKEAQYNLKNDYHFNPNWKQGDPIVAEKSLLQSKNCVYISALNAASALKKFNKGDDGSRYDKSKSIPLTTFG